MKHNKVHTPCAQFIGCAVGATGRHPDSKVHGANMGPTWVLSAPGRPHVGPRNLAIRAGIPGKQKEPEKRSIMLHNLTYTHGCSSCDLWSPCRTLTKGHPGFYTFIQFLPCGCHNTSLRLILSHCLCNSYLRYSAKYMGRIVCISYAIQHQYMNQWFSLLVCMLHRGGTTHPASCYIMI